MHKGGWVGPEVGGWEQLVVDTACVSEVHCLCPPATQWAAPQLLCLPELMCR
jgi:hypothetical protein